MRILSGFFIGVFMFGAAVSAAAADLESSPYEQQLRLYSRFHSEFMDQKKEEHEKKRLDIEEMRLIAEQLRLDQRMLLSGIEEKEVQIEQLKALNEKLYAVQAIMHDQYVELEALFREQKRENEHLKLEVELGKRAFYVNVIEFYQEEDLLLTEKLADFQDRQESIRGKIREAQEELEALGR